MTELLELWGLVHPYLDHIVFGLIFGYIGYVMAKRLGKTGSAKTKYGIPILVTAIALAMFKYFESTLPVNTPTFVPGVSLNTVGGDFTLKVLRQVMTVAAGGVVPLLYEKFFNKKIV